MNIIGLDIGGTKIAIVYAEYHDEVVIKDKRIIKTDTENGVCYMLGKICKTIEELVKDNGLTDFTIGISCGGTLDSKKGIILSPPNLPGWDHVKIVEHLEDRFNMKAFLQNDADACAIAEWKIGAGKGSENMIFLTFGTGLGAGLILNSKLYSGTNGMAGEVGHIRLSNFGPSGYGKVGSFEGFCSGGGIAQLAKTMLLAKIQSGQSISFLGDKDIEDITAQDVFENANIGHADALEIVQVVGENLGKGLAVIIDILNPQKIVIGSIFERNHTLLSKYAAKIIEKEALTRSAKECKIEPAQTGDSIGDFAAVLTAVYGKEQES